MRVGGSASQLLLLAVSAGWLAIASVVPQQKKPDQPKVSFGREILPLLSDKCFKCHGPDAGSRMADMRLDTPQDAFAERGGRWPIVPGKPQDSLVVKRITAGEMPPHSSGKTLSKDEIALITRWIAEGAQYGKLWSFEPLPAAVPVPTIKSDWPKDDIDRFILARMQREGLNPSPPATKDRWLRRVTLDLTGLPPTEDEIVAFDADKGKDAYETVVDRLLASPHYGERAAVDWLDAARYSDSYGYQSDLLMPTWPYRDWVVKSFNEDLPYDQFLTDQISAIDLGAPWPGDPSSKVVTYQCLCRVKGKARFALVKSADTDVIYDEVVIDSPDGLSDVTLVTLRLQLLSNAPLSYTASVLLENLADSGGTAWQVFWQQAWGGSEASETYPIAGGLANAGQVRNATDDLAVNTYNWAVNALGIKAASRFQLPLLDTSSGGDAEGMGWRSPDSIAPEDYDLVDGELNFDDFQHALMGRALLKWWCLVQPEAVDLDPQTSWTGGRAKNQVFTGDTSFDLTLDTTLDLVPPGSMVRVYNFGVGDDPEPQITVKVGASTLTVVDVGKMCECLFYVDESDVSPVGRWLLVNGDVDSKQLPAP